MEYHLSVLHLFSKYGIAEKMSNYGCSNLICPHAKLLMCKFALSAGFLLMACFLAFLGAEIHFICAPNGTRNCRSCGCRTELPRRSSTCSSRTRTWCRSSGRTCDPRFFRVRGFHEFGVVGELRSCIFLLSSSYRKLLSHYAACVCEWRVCCPLHL